jgi:short subunit dehydrogenase-like uncharacterized protein
VGLKRSWFKLRLLTPAIAMGDHLLGRLQRAGMRFRVL